MTTPQRIIRWLAVVVYSTAILSALVVPHAHHAGCSDCCGEEACSVGHAEHAHCHHDHAGHVHSHAGGDEPHSHDDPAKRPVPFDDDCPVCRFLTQPLQFAQAVALATREEPVAFPPPVSISLPPAPPAALHPARGPPDRA